MSLIDAIRQKARAFVLGPGVVQSSDLYWGKGTEEWQPAEYGDYIATSNGVYACATLRASLLASLPLRLYRLEQDGTKAEITSGQLLGLLQKVNPFWTFGRLMRMTELSLSLWGEAFWFLERGKSGTIPPREIWWGRPDRVRVVPDATEYIKGFVYKPANGSEDLVFSPGEVFWLRYDNPLDEYEGLAPLAAARLAADVASAAMKSNYNLFDQGMQMGGVVYPKKDKIWSTDQVTQMEKSLAKRFRGVDKAHRWGVFREEVGIEGVGISPKDAEFLGAMAWSLEEICRAYKVPLDLIGGQRTYQNVEAAMKAIWVQAIIPEARFIASELVEQLLPMFPGQAAVAEFDTTGVDVLQEDRGEIIGQMKTLFDMGVPLNPLLNEFQPNLLPETGAYEWGDVWWAPLNLMPTSGEEPTQPAEEPEPERIAQTRQVEIAYGSQQHEILWRRFVRRTEAHERLVGEAVAEMFERLQDSVISRLKAEERAIRAGEGTAFAPFDMPKWIKAFRKMLRPILELIFGDAAEAALEDVGLTIDFNLYDPRVTQFLEKQTQRFATPVLETTWKDLRGSLVEGIEGGESIPELADRVESVMGDRIRSSKTTIARTETIRANNGGTQMAWEQSGVVAGKKWLSALDERTRDTHIAAHGQVVPIDDNFVVGACEGPTPGDTGCAEEDINCRCSMTAVIKERAVVHGDNGRGEVEHDSVSESVSTG